MKEGRLDGDFEPLVQPTSEREETVDETASAREGGYTKMPPIVLRFPAPVKPWSTNDDHGHWAPRLETVTHWRSAGKLYALRDRIGTLPPSTVQVAVTYPQLRRRDPSNLVGTVVKALVDGLVDARVWPDDTAEWVTVLEPTILVQRGWHQVAVTITAR